MKKLLFILVFLMGAMIMNAQAGSNPQHKSTLVKVADLPKALTDNIAKDYAGFTIKEASSVMMNNNLNYDVVITKGTTSETLVYDKDGKFIRKVTQKVMMNPAPKKK